MDMEALIKSMKPVAEVIPPEQGAEKTANETPLQKLFDDRVGPETEGMPAINYHVYSPPREGGKYPVLIWLHGMGQGYCHREPVRGTAISNFASPEYQAKFGGGAYIMVPRANEDLGKVDTLARFMYSNSWIAGGEEGGTPSQLAGLVAAIKQFLEEEKEHIDPNRVYLAGFSAGGFMTWQVLLAMPEAFAAAAPICHARIVPTARQLETIEDVPLWIVCGEQDALYTPFVAPTIGALAGHKAELRTSILDTVYNPDRTVVEHQHFSWVPVTYDMLYDDGKPYDEKYPKGFIAWLTGHKKGGK
jgi:predicted peptidase